MQAVSQAVTLKAKLFRGFADPSRLAILDVLRPGPRSVGEIVAETGLGQSNTSNHLACLYDCGLVTREQRGKYVFYRLSDERVGTLLALCDDLLADALAGIYDCMRYTGPERGS